MKTCVMNKKQYIEWNSYYESVVNNPDSPEDVIELLETLDSYIMIVD